MDRVPLPKIIYNALEDVLEAQIRRLVGDVAKSLKVDPKPLLQSVSQEKTLVYLFEESVDDYNLHTARCKSYELEKHKGADIYIPCKNAVVYTRDYCVAHAKHRSTVPATENILNCISVDGTRYYVDKHNRVYSLELQKIGLYFPKSSKILLFKVAENL